MPRKQSTDFAALALDGSRSLSRGSLHSVPHPTDAAAEFALQRTRDHPGPALAPDK
jgi:hypothetical protein